MAEAHLVAVLRPHHAAQLFQLGLAGDLEVAPLDQRALFGPAAPMKAPCRSSDRRRGLILGLAFVADQAIALCAEFLNKKNDGGLILDDKADRADVTQVDLDAEWALA